LTDRIGEALQAVAATDDVRGTNVAVEGMILDDVRELVGRPASVAS
jgi:hypothetical protein